MRLGLAGGGTDLLSFSSIYEGAVFNATIQMYSYCTLEPTDNGKVEFVAPDRNCNVILEAKPVLEIEEPLLLHRAVYNRIVKDYNDGKPISLKMSTSSDAPSGSGLGTSSVMVCCILKAYERLLGLDLNEYEFAHLAYSIEREDLGLKGGMQDQYATAFGGFNFMEFKKDGSVVVNPLRLSSEIVNELESSLLLYYNGRSHDSSKIISEQIKNTQSNNSTTIQAMLKIKDTAYRMKDAVLKGNISQIASIMRENWEEKKKTSAVVSNKDLEIITSYAFANGAEALKLSGAGGGGFILLYVNPTNRQQLFDALKKLNGIVWPVAFGSKGARSWLV